MKLNRPFYKAGSSTSLYRISFGPVEYSRSSCGYPPREFEIISLQGEVQPLTVQAFDLS